MSEMKWIPVTERLPKKDEYVLCYSEYDTWFIGYRGFHSGEWIRDGVMYPAEITHWMPLPEPPERSDVE